MVELNGWTRKRPVSVKCHLIRCVGEYFDSGTNANIPFHAFIYGRNGLSREQCENVIRKANKGVSLMVTGIEEADDTYTMGFEEFVNTVMEKENN